jgi:hypothetical protein
MIGSTQSHRRHTRPRPAGQPSRQPTSPSVNSISFGSEHPLPGGVEPFDQRRLAGAAFDEAVGVAVEAGGQRLVVQVADDVAGKDVAFEMGDRAGLRGAHVGGVADDEDVLAGLQGVLVDGDEAEAGERPR